MDCWVQKFLFKFKVVENIDVCTSELLLQDMSFNTFINILESTKVN